VLLVLDNFEHVLDAAGDVADILAASARSAVVVTSRAPLRIAGEQEYPLDPLGDACVRLFVERARAVRPGWDPGAHAAVVDEVCALVDRTPFLRAGYELLAGAALR
jgi:predicted ATPase